ERRGSVGRAVSSVPDTSSVQRGQSAHHAHSPPARHDHGPLVDRPARPVPDRSRRDRATCASKDHARCDRALARRRQPPLGHRPGATAHPRGVAAARLSRCHRLGAPDAELVHVSGGGPVRALRLAASAVIAGGVCVAAAPLAAAGVQSCAPAPQHLRFVATPHRPSGVVTWRAPRAMPTGAGGYRVFRNGRVVGQTPLRVRRIRVSFRPGRILKLQVRVALRTGRLWRCGTVLALKPPWHAPGRPGDLVATADPDSATLTWLPSARGDGTLDGYRIFVDGRVARQVRTTSATLSLTPLHSHTVAVAAVDTQGAESALSNAVEV